MVDKALDCYGTMYNSDINACKDKCVVRFQCKAEVTKRFHELGKEKFQKLKEKVIMANEQQEDKAESVDVTENDIQPQMSELVMTITDIMKNCGLQIVFRKGYIAFKSQNRNVFALGKTKTSSLKNLIKFVYTQKFEEFEPNFAEKYVTKDLHGGRHTMIVEKTDDIKEIVEAYLKSILE